MTSDDQVNAALEREAEFDRLELEVGASTAPYLRATTAERDRRVLAAEVRRLREENAVYEPAAKNWPAMIARCEAAEVRATEHLNARNRYAAELDAARAEAARLREARADDVALVARLSHQVVALRGAITRVLDGPHYIDRDYQDVLLAALDTPGRAGHARAGGRRGMKRRALDFRGSGVTMAVRRRRGCP